MFIFNLERKKDHKRQRKTVANLQLKARFYMWKVLCNKKNFIIFWLF